MQGKEAIQDISPLMTKNGRSNFKEEGEWGEAGSCKELAVSRHS